MELYLFVTSVKCKMKQKLCLDPYKYHSMKEKLTIIIKLSLGKRQIDYKRVNRLQSLEAKTTIKKKGKKQLMVLFLLQVYLLESWWVR